MLLRSTLVSTSSTMYVTWSTRCASADAAVGLEPLLPRFVASLAHEGGEPGAQGIGHESLGACLAVLEREEPLPGRRAQAAHEPAPAHALADGHRCQLG